MRTEQEGNKWSNWKDILKIHENQEKEGKRKWATTLPEITIFRLRRQKNYCKRDRKRREWINLILQSWMKTGSDKLFVMYLNDSTKTGKPIKNYMDCFIITSLNYMSIRSCLVLT